MKASGAQESCGQLLGNARDEVAEVIGFQAQPELFNGIEVGAAGEFSADGDTPLLSVA